MAETGVTDDVQLANSAEEKGEQSNDLNEIGDESALRENIRLKGKNSYYYAHGHNNDAPEWDGDPSPKLLASRKLLDQKPVTQIEPIKTYSWADADSKVKIYIPLDNIGAPDEEKSDVQWTANSFTLQVTNSEDAKYLLAVDSLNDNIKGASMKIRPNKIIVTLQKELDVSWHDLRKTA
uniref:CS domain-containing protein n=1 Tax=Fibrocapsa japonica TaxID=94617 RepID=A0A7S2Y0T4_9STRA|mmetsp:Transcript_7342/g.11045  ORF Transcript_7342/g.11045 Transcript_7342/m.11045 type:complete len:179 (+) Transcript_7342:31-567(+)